MASFDSDDRTEISTSAITRDSNPAGFHFEILRVRQDKTGRVDRVLNCRGKWMFRSEAILYRHDPALRFLGESGTECVVRRDATGDPPAPVKVDDSG